MPLTLDPEIAALLAAAAQTGARQDMPPPGDVMALRAFTDASLGAMFARMPDAPDVAMTAYAAEVDTGKIPLRWYSKNGVSSDAAVIYVHGGGMVAGSAPAYDRLVRHYVQLTGVNFLSVDYRLAPEYRTSGLAHDVFAALQWLRSQKDTLTIDTGRIAIMGDSGGGGIAAATAIMARDAGVAVNRQILIYPMLDDRNTVPDPLLAPTAFWSYDNNATAWAAVLGDALGKPDVSPFIAPARLAEFSGLPRAYIEVGELDIFRDESIRYANALLAAGVSCELHVHPGSPHGYDLVGTSLGVTQRAFADRVRIITAL